MDRARRPRSVLAALTAALLAVPALTALSSPAGAADADVAVNGGFESGLTGWTCTAGTTVDSPVHSGRSALQATPAGSDNAQCVQTVAVQPDAQYTLSGYVRGSYVYLGANGTGTADVSTWTQSAPDWQKLTTTFRTGPATTKVTIHTHGWYGTGAYQADDITLVGPGGSGTGQPPAA
ncbi:carbohydrate binding domain-containing protein, partial [Streptomyces longwoodensis]|uniref:carbohydrate binding domain-containing protein n=1 Tax=Streptomyces longwoodensis TaxID=68231 RepID=UPI0033B84A93